MAKMNFRKNCCACRWTRNSMKYGQSWDAEAQARHNRKRSVVILNPTLRFSDGQSSHDGNLRVGIMTPKQELAETVRRQKEEN